MLRETHLLDWCIAIIILLAIILFDFFVQGMEADVPRYLRIDGSVKNRKLSLKEVNELINGFWHHRLNSSHESQFPVSDD